MAILLSSFGIMFVKVQRVFLGLVFLVAFSPTTARADDEISIDLPAGAQLKVRNDFGDVSATVWNKTDLAVSATIGDTTARFTRLPVLIDNRGSLVTITVFRRPLDPVAPIHLSLKIPETSRFDAITTTGKISMLGLPGSATLKSSSGIVEASFYSGSDAEITARALRGTIKSSLGSEPATDTQRFQTRIGNGSKKLNVQTDTGDIALSYIPGGPYAFPVSTAKQPELIGGNNAKPSAGTPDGPVPGDEVSEGDVIRVESQLVTLNISVIDRGTNRGLMGLEQGDFKLFEDGQEQRILQFESSSAPFDLMLLIDLSGSTRDVVKLIRAAALRFVESARPADRIGVITFAGQPSLVSPLTSDRELLRQRIETIDTARGDTKLYDATNFAIDEVLKESKKTRRTAIVLMSDGLDGTIPGISGQQGSRHTYEETLRNIQEFDGVLYTLWLNTEYEAMSPLDTQPEAFDAGHDRMREMADAGGGIFYEVEKLTDLAGAYQQVVADLGTTYSLAYRPSNNTRDGRWRSIRIAVGRANAVPRGKRGYYAN
jgi:VWFA-related protein